MKTSTVLLLILFAQIYVHAAAPRARESFRETTEFDKWPGRGGPLKKGFFFKQTDYAVLDSFKITDDRTQFSSYTSPHEHPDGDVKGLPVVERTIRLKKNADELEVKIGVSCESTDQAQEAFFLDITGRSNVLMKRENPPILGDVLFDESGMLSFVRNNIFVVIKSESQELRHSVAKAMDARIVAAPIFTAVELRKLKPQVTQFSPATPVIFQALGNRLWGKTPLTIETKDPSGEHVSVMSIDTQFKVRIEKNTDGTFLAHAQIDEGTFPLHLTVVNDSLLYNSVSSEITVKK